MNSGRGSNIKYRPHAFTEHGAIQAANVLNSPRAVETGVYVVRAFVKLRELLASNKELAGRLEELEARIQKKLTTHDQAIAAILSAIRQLMNPPAPARRPILASEISDHHFAPLRETKVPDRFADLDAELEDWRP